MPHHRNLAPPAQQGADQPVIHLELREHYDALYDLLLNGRRARDARPVLDVGSGDGLALNAIVQGTPLHGIAIDSATTSSWLGPSGWSLVQADAQRLPFPDACFPSALMVDVFEWLRHPAATLREIARATNGSILIVQTDWEGLWFQVERAEIGRELMRGFTRGAPEELRGLIRSTAETAGVTVAQMSSVSIETDRLELGSLAWDVLESVRRFLVIESAQVRARRFDDWRSELQQAADEGQFSMLVRRVVALLDASQD